MISLLLLAVSSPASALELSLSTELEVSAGLGLTCGDPAATSVVAEVRFELDELTVVDLVDIEARVAARYGLCSVTMSDAELTVDGATHWSSSLDLEGSGALIADWYIDTSLATGDIEAVVLGPGEHVVQLVVHGTVDSSSEALGAALDLSVWADGDYDDDGVDDADEDACGTDPTDPDSDGDGVDDGAELDEGTDPLDPEDAGDGGGSSDPGDGEDPDGADDSGLGDHTTIDEPQDGAGEPDQSGLGQGSDDDDSDDPGDDDGGAGSSEDDGTDGGGTDGGDSGDGGEGDDSDDGDGTDDGEPGGLPSDDDSADAPSGGGTVFAGGACSSSGAQPGGWSGLAAFFALGLLLRRRRS